MLLLRMGGGDVAMGRQRPLTSVCRGVFQIWWKYWHGIRTVWDQGSHSDVVEDTYRVACHTVFLGKYLTVSGIVVPSSSGSWLWRRRPCDFFKSLGGAYLSTGHPIRPSYPGTLSGVRPVRRADSLTTIFVCRLSWNLGATDSWNPQGLSRPVMGLLCVAGFEKAVSRCSSKFYSERKVSRFWLSHKRKLVFI